MSHVYASQPLVPTTKTALLDQLVAMQFADLCVSKMTSAFPMSDAVTVSVYLSVGKMTIVAVVNYAHLVCAKLVVGPMVIVLRLRPALIVSALILAARPPFVAPTPIVW